MHLHFAKRAGLTVCRLTKYLIAILASSLLKMVKMIISGKGAVCLFVKANHSFSKAIFFLAQ